ncbi:hypothetical protein C8R43DRAFT_483522 [Mycena crocata]|nr:hypothetical protein C8R43DRAFT_483522 [Mycena crocata]
MRSLQLPITLTPAKTSGASRGLTITRRPFASMSSSIPPPVSGPLKPGLVHKPTTYAATKTFEELLHKDYVSHHCFVNDLGFHNHLPHHLVAAYDMGAPPALLKLIYEDELPILRPLDRQGTDITESNWTTRLGEHNVWELSGIFSDQVAKDGVEETMRKYVMSAEANGNGAAMLGRFLAGAFHPFMQVGFGVELGQDYIVAQALAMAAVTSPDFTNFILEMSSGLIPISNTADGVTLLALLREVYDSPILDPILPYDPTSQTNDRLEQVTSRNPQCGAELKRIYSKWSLGTTLTGAAASAHFAIKAEECLWQATLLLAATGLKPGHAPRLDFFLMHILTSALCIPSLLSVLRDPLHKAQLLQGYVRASALFMLSRGRPRIDIPLLMAYTASPRPSASLVKHSGSHGDALGNPSTEGETDPWLPIVQNALHHKDAHVIKAVRTLYYCAQRYGTTPPGGAIGARGIGEDGNGNGTGVETHRGAGEMDGSIFVRAAAVMSDTLGWVAYGEVEGDWDTTALGWDAAWDYAKGSVRV